MSDTIEAKVSPNTGELNQLAAYAAYLRQHHVEALAVENLRLCRRLQVPLLELFAHLPEAELVQQGIQGMALFLADLEAGRALDTAARSLEAWEADQLPGVSKDAIQPSDLVLVYAAQKRAIISFLPHYTADAAQAIAIAGALEDYYTEVQEGAFKLYARLREEAVLRANLSEAHAEELAALNEELMSQSEELAAQTEELNSLYDELKGHSERVEQVVAVRTEELRAKARELQAANEELTAQSEALVAQTEELHQKSEQLRMSERHKDEFLNVISHELRTPLNFIMGFGSLMEDDPELSELHKSYVSKILLGADRMLGLVEDLLDVARLKAGKVPLAQVPTPYAPLIAEVVSTMAPLAAQRSLRVETQVDVPGLPEIDGPRIVQVLTNLISNAIKFTPEGGRIVVRAHVSDGWVVTEVEDNGPGIPPAELERIFDPFHQVDMSATREASGTGLGLSIVRALVEAHGGVIGVRSTLGQGSIFSVRLRG